MIKIGYIGSADPVGIELLPESQPKRADQLTNEFIKNCPGISNYYKNTFVIHAPYTLEYTVSKNADGSLWWEIHPENTTLSIGSPTFPTEDIVQIQGDAFAQINPRPQWGFISDTPNVYLLQHTNGITTNPQIVSGMFDIYKWPDRAVSVAYPVEIGKRVRINKGEPWYNITFITPNFEPVKLVRMYERTGFLSATRNKHNTSYMSKQFWPRVFDYFASIRPKRLIKEQHD